MPEYSGDVTGLGTLRVLEAIRKTGIQTRLIRLHQLRCSGHHPTPPQNELTPFKSESPYASDMVYAYYMVKNYRKTYNIFGCNWTLFNHELSRRG
jgi:GDPmannose 4,6-dehydratase